ncbi:MAG: hypothetical protein ABIU63_03925 [Chitinophagaceae bacterium]
MRNVSDRQIIRLVVFFLVLYLCVLVAGILINQLLYATAIINATAAVLMIGYRSLDYFRLRQRKVETRELIFLLVECFCTGIAGYTLLAAHPGAWLIILQYVIFGIHALLLLLFLGFMLLFNMKKLL